ncbi:MAG: tetratricopeptide repeat protein [Candidatus Sigynarchaeum springense]
MTTGDVPSEASEEESAFISLIKQGHLELARSKIAMLAKKYPNVPKFHFNFALVLYKLKRYDEALDEINEGLWLKPDDLKALRFKKEIIESRSRIITSDKGQILHQAMSVAAPVEPAPSKAEPNPEPVAAPVKPAPPKAEPKPEPVAAPMEPAPSKAEPNPEPAATQVEPELPKPEPEPEPAAAPAEPAPSKAEPNPEPVAAPADPAPPKAEPKPMDVDQAQGESEKPTREILPSEPVVIGNSGPSPAEVHSGPTLVSSIPGPLVIATSVTTGKTLDADETIEIEPRITIHEKAAEITVSAIESKTPTLSGSPPGSQELALPKPEKKELTVPIIDEVKPSPRLTNLKDFFKGSRAGIEPSKDTGTNTGAVLADTVELEPRALSRKLGIRTGTDENTLVSFASIKELESYKYSIQALVEKYLHHKLDREILDTDDDESTPIVIAKEPSPPVENATFSEADLSPHEAASAGKAIIAEITENESAGDFIPEPGASGAEIKENTVIEPGEMQTQQIEPGAPASTLAMASTNKALGNVAGTQQLLVELLSTASGNQSYRIDMAIMQHLNASVTARARSGKLMQVRGEVLSQIVDMEKYSALVRLNRTIGKVKPSRINMTTLPSAQQSIGEIEACTTPVKSYRPETFAKEQSMDFEKQISQILSGDQNNMSDDALAKFLSYIKQVGDGQAIMAASGDDAALKAAMAKIKRVALALYNNTQYEQAIQIYSTFLDFFPEDFEALFNLGFCYRELGNYKDSEDMFKRIIELFYDNAYAWYNLSVIYSFTTEGDKEAYCLQRAREFGYVVDLNRLSRLLVAYTPKNPFDA